MKRRTALLALSACLLLTPFAAADARRTSFDPGRHGFAFTNDFTNDFIPALNLRTSGLCIGMSYATLDYYFAKLPVPAQDYRPANRTPLQSYLYGRNVTGIERNLDKWAELGFNPFGVRDNEFFEWGLRGFGGGRLQELRSYLDRGVPVPLGLSALKSGNHCVVAIGYDLGRYKGDLKANRGDLKIFVYDPNFPGRTMTLVPNLGGHYYTYREAPAHGWRAYFVDARYRRQAPPRLPNPNYPKDGTVRELILAFTTGNDDLRGGNDNLDLLVNLFDGTQQTFPNINRSGRWLPNYTEYARVVLHRPVAPKQIKNLVLSVTTRGGIAGDNWDMKSVSVRALGGGLSQDLRTAGFNRFTGDRKQLTVPINAAPAAARGLVSQLVLEVRTGGDDLRGGNDNLNVAVGFRDGKVQHNANVNGGARWPDNTTRTVTIPLNRPVPAGDIKNVTLSTTFTGGIGGDNWNMDWIRVRAVGLGVNRLIATSGFYRFTGQKKVLNLSAAAAGGH